MEKIRKSFSFCLPLIFIFLTSCSMPKIIILEDPLSAEEHNNLGVAYEKKGMLELAEKEYKKAIKKRKKWDTPYFNLGNVYFKKKDFEKAKDYYKKAIEINPKNTDAMNNLAYLYFLEGKYSEALRLVKKAISLRFKTEYLNTLKEIEEKIYRSD